MTIDNLDKAGLEQLQQRAYYSATNRAEDVYSRRKEEEHDIAEIQVYLPLKMLAVSMVKCLPFIKSLFGHSQGAKIRPLYNNTTFDIQHILKYNYPSYKKTKVTLKMVLFIRWHYHLLNSLVVEYWLQSPVKDRVTPKTL